MGIGGNATVPELSPKKRFCDTEPGWSTPSGATDMRGSEKAEVIPTPLFPLVGRADRAIILNPPHHVHQRLRCPVRVLHRAPPYRPAFHGLGSGSETAPPLRSRSLQRREALGCYAAAAAVAAAVASEREGGGGGRGRRGRGGLLAAGHACKNNRCGGMRGRSRSRRTPAAHFFIRYSPQKPP